MSAFPHSCPQCGAAAFVGFNLVDCSNPSCTHAGRAARQRSKSGTIHSFQCWSADRGGPPCSGNVVAIDGAGTCPDCGSHYAVGVSAAA